MVSQIYSSLWSKYRPAIIQLMLSSSEGQQAYKLYDHEFRTLNAREKSYAFTLQAYQGKALNNIKTSAMAQDLLSVLNQSKKASELLSESPFEFTLDKQFVLRITRLPPIA